MTCGHTAGDPHRPGGTPFEEGQAQLRTGRRTLLTMGGAGLVFSALSGSRAAQAADAARAMGAGRRTRRAYVVVIDGCRPEELDLGLTPRLTALRNGGLRFPSASSMPVTETIPNHVMMMTGVRPDRTGVPANSIFDRAEGVVRDLDRPTDIKVETLIERMNAQRLRTGTVLSKEYLYGIFGERAGRRWEPAPVIPVSGHAPDQFTIQAAVAMADEWDPHLMFVNLGDIDRVGHSDYTGPTVRGARKAALVDTDRLVGSFLDHLVETGKWEQSMVLVLADHAMDWSIPTRVISLTAPLAADPLLAGKVRIAQNGGADLLYWTGSAAQRAEAIRRMRAIAAATPGVLQALARTDKSLRLGPQAGDVVAYAQAGWRFSDPSAQSNPLPGNHGHPATRRIPFFIGGGHPAVPRGRSSSREASTVDVAPTVGSFFGLSAPTGGYDGTARL